MRSLLVVVADVGALLHLAISAFGVLHLETRTPEMALPIGLFESFSRARSAASLHFSPRR